MFRTAVNIQNILEWVEKAKRPFPNDSDTAFLSRLINTHYPDKQSIDSIYKAFDNITRPEKEVLNTVAQLKLSNITSFCPYFLHFSWGLFSQTKREADSDENTAAFQESNAQSRTATLVLMLTKLGTLQLLDKKFKKPEMHAKYFATINTLINEGHLNIRKCAEMKSSDFSTISKMIEVWIGLPILSHESSDPTLDITRHETRERIRQLTYETLLARCQHPMKDPFRWDGLEKDLMEQNSPHNSEYITGIIENSIYEDMQNLYNEIEASVFPLTRYQRSELKHAFISGYINTLREQAQRGFDKTIDLSIHIATLSLSFRMSRQLEHYCDEDKLRALIDIRNTFNEQGANYYGEHLDVYRTLKMIVPHHTNSIMSNMLLSGTLMALWISKQWCDSEEPAFVSESTYNTLCIINIVCYLMVSFILHKHITQISLNPIILADSSWADVALERGNELRLEREVLLTQEKHEHDEFMEAMQRKDAERKDKPRVAAERQKALEAAVEQKIEQQTEAERKAREEYENKLRQRHIEEKEEAQRIKEARRRAHYEKRQEKTDNIIVAFGAQNPIPAPPREPAVIPVPAAPAPNLAAGPQPQPQPQPKQAQAQAEAPVPLVMFALGDKRRDELINHIRAIMRILHAHIKEQRINDTPESLMALKYDLLQVCEHIFAIRSRQGCGQKVFIDTLIDSNHIEYIYQIRNGLIHHDAALPPNHKFALYHMMMNQLSLMGHLYRPGTEILPNTICQQAKAQPADFPIQFNFEPALQANYQQLVAVQPNLIMDQAFKVGLEGKHGYLAHIADEYLKSSQPEHIEKLGKVLLMTIAELGEVYKEVFVKQKLSRQFYALYPGITINEDMTERFINARRDIVHIRNPREGDVGVILSTGGAVFKQNAQTMTLG